MNALLIYFLKAAAVQAVLYFIYALVFHKSGRYAINRFYLILALVLGFLIPLITLPDFQPSEKFVESGNPIWNELAEMSEFSTKEDELMPVEKLSSTDFVVEFLFLGTSLVSLCLLFRLIFSHFQLASLKRKSERIVKNDCCIYVGKMESPFSYFNAIFIPHHILSADSFDTILKHELVHVNKYHSFDRIFVEIMLAIFWFNPVYYLFRNRLIETHEFQADEGVIVSQNDPIGYQEVLYQQINSQYTAATANHFKLKTIKTRIKMINKNGKLSKWHYLLLLPVLAIMIFSFANKEKEEFIAPLKSDFSHVFDYVINPSDNYTPSIFPLKDADGVKLTSGFGMRMNPLLNVEKMHDGVDFKTRSGNPVMATADGEVVEAGDFGPYGNKIVLKHNDIYQTSYAHLSEISIEKGDKVKRGEVIGTSGNSGKSTGPHLHYEVKEIGNGFLDPVDFIKDYDFKTISTSSTKDVNTPSIFPLKDADGVKLTASFGKSIHPILKVERMHEGIDLKTHIGNPVVATADGIVVEAGIISEIAWGKIIRIKHGDVYETVYAHLSEVQVKKGDQVKRGDLIGNAGSTGESTGPHLHYEVKDAAGGFLDPLDFIHDFEFEVSTISDQPNESSLSKTDQKLRVLIDPGHGGEDKGMTSSALPEKDIVLKVAKKVADNFKESKQIEVILTRDADKVMSLEERVSNSKNSDLFISLHIETHAYKEESSMLAIYNDQNDHASQSKYFSELLAQEMESENKILKVGYSSGYYVLKNAKCPAVLFSLGYFSNPESEEYLNSEEGMNEIAQELSDALEASL